MNPTEPKILCYHCGHPLLTAKLDSGDISVILCQVCMQQLQEGIRAERSKHERTISVQFTN